VALFVRRGKKYTELTEAGAQILSMAERLLAEADNIRRTGAEFARGDAGTLSIAATHTQARYALPRHLMRFRQEFPRVRLRLHQGNPRQVAAMVEHGEATFGFATEALDVNEALSTRPIYRWRHCVVVPREHPLAAQRRVDLATLAGYPLVTYSPEFAGRRKVDQAFEAAGLRPDVVLEAIDSDVIKYYVELGMGVGLIAGIAYDPQRDHALVRIGPEDLFPANVAKLATRRAVALRGFEQRFVDLVTGGVPPGAAPAA
jgi:DNA-binding transcriptional LysR family regulator